MWLAATHHWVWFLTQTGDARMDNRMTIKAMGLGVLISTFISQGSASGG
jgi:PIN domain nuclease of toxin-antitoxin system